MGTGCPALERKVPGQPAGPCILGLETVERPVESGEPESRSLPFEVWELEIRPAVWTVQLRTGQQSLGSQLPLLQDIALVFGGQDSETSACLLPLFQPWLVRAEVEVSGRAR